MTADKSRVFTGFRARGRLVALSLPGLNGRGDLSTEGGDMRKLALLAAVCAAAIAATGAGAATPEHHRIPVKDTFFAPFMSDACGVPVTITIEGTANVLLQRNDAGLIVREHDVLSSFTAGFESPTELGGTGRAQ